MNVKERWLLKQTSYSMGVLKEYDEAVNPLRQVVGAAMTVFNEWGAGLLESAYEAGIKHLLEKEHKVERQKYLPIYWKDEKLEEYYRMDLVVDDIIVELKACKFISNDHRRQLHNYMRLTKNTYGLLINFAERQVFSEAFKLYSDGSIEKVPLKMSCTTEDWFPQIIFPQKDFLHRFLFEEIYIWNI